VLFPEAVAPGLVRIESAVLAAQSWVEYFDLEARSILNRCSSSRMPFAWTINPYLNSVYGLFNKARVRITPL
jgi:hypothetical protein